MTFDDITKELGELCKEYLTNTTFRNNLKLLMKISIRGEHFIIYTY